MNYRAPVADILLAMRTSGGLDRAIDNGLYQDLTIETVEAVLEEAAKMAEGVLAPLNRSGDTTGARFENGAVTTPPGWRRPAPMSSRPVISRNSSPANGRAR